MGGEDEYPMVKIFPRVDTTFCIWCALFGTAFGCILQLKHTSKFSKGAKDPILVPNVDHIKVK